MKQATRLTEYFLKAVLIGVAFFMPVFAYAQNSGVIIAEQLDYSGDVAGHTMPYPAATSSTGFLGYSPAYIHLKVLNTSGADTIGGSGNIHFYGDTACSIQEQIYTVDTTVISASASIQDVYMDLTNPLAFATSTVKCIQVYGLASQFPANTRVYTNSNYTLPYFELGVTFSPFSSGSFNVITGAPTTTAAFGTNATSSAACDAIDADSIGLAWALCTTASYLFVPAPDVWNDFFGLPEHIMQKFPFSILRYVQSKLDGLTITGAGSNMITLDYDFHDLGIGSTTPMGNILPNITVFSSSTVTQYIGAPQWDVFQSLIAGALWLMLIGYLFREVQRLAERRGK